MAHEMAVDSEAYRKQKAYECAFMTVYHDVLRNKRGLDRDILELASVRDMFFFIFSAGVMHGLEHKKGF